MKDILRVASQDINNTNISGLKVNLMRIIANLSYKHFPSQELVRNHHGLEVVLNQCIIDPKNECKFKLINRI